MFNVERRTYGVDDGLEDEKLGILVGNRIFDFLIDNENEMSI